MISEAMLDVLGIETVHDSGREIRALCPVHHLVMGRPDNKPSWYINVNTGAWLCFSCHQRGSFRTLVEMLGGDQDLLEDIPIEVMKARVAKWHEEDEPEPTKPAVYISEYGFSTNPLPHKAMRLQKDIKKIACEEYNVRWSIEGRCFLIPLYTVAEGKLIGWQEKSKGYFMNVPDDVPKRLCLFGYQQFARGSMIMVESPLDVVRMASYGIRGGVATMGSYVSDEQLDAAVRASDTIILAFDDDEAGETARDHCARWIKNDGRAQARYFRYPKGNRLPNGKAKFSDPGELPIDDVRVGIETASLILRTDRRSLV